MKSRTVKDFVIAAIPPAQTDAGALLDSVVRARGLAILDTSLPACEAIAKRLLELPGARIAILTDAVLGVETADLLEKLPARPEAVIIRGTPEGRIIRFAAHRVFAIVTSEREAEAAIAAGVDGLIGKGNEAGGAVGSETTFVLLQRLCARFSVPVWAYGGIGPHGAAACLAGGAQGIVLQDQLSLADEASLPEALRNRIAAMDGTETICLGEAHGRRFRVHRQHAADTIRRLRRLESTLDAADFAEALAESLRLPLTEAPLPVGQDAAFAARLAERHRTAGGIVQAYRRQLVDNLRLASEKPPLSEHSSLAEDFRCRYPVVQGPMTRVSDVAGLANAVSQGGALPFLALALMRGQECEMLLRETAAVMEDRSWGVGILAFAPKDVRDEQLKAVLKVHPPFAILAGGRPDQVRALESKGISTYVHAPSANLIDQFLRQGTRKFILEGRECGGHVGPLASLVLWEAAIEAVLAFQNGRPGKEPIDILFAGGIHDSRSAAMVSAMAGSAHAAGVRIGVLMGTAYLFTREAVETGAILPSFQNEAMQCVDTALLDTDGGHAIRCAPSPYVAEFQKTSRDLQSNGLEPEEVRAQLELINIGRLRLASKGLIRSENSGATIGSRLEAAPAERQKQEGMFMLGQVAALRREVGTIADLHRDVIAGSTARMEQFAEAEFERGPGIHSSGPEPIAIVGIACHLPDASDLPEYWGNILRLHDAIREVPEDRWRTDLYYEANTKNPDRVYSKWGGFIGPIRFDPMAFGIAPNTLRSVEAVHLIALEMARRALADAGYEKRPFPREKTGVVFGTSGGTWDLGLAYQARCLIEHYMHSVPGIDPAVRDETIRGLRHILPAMTEDSFPGILPNVLAGRIANRLNFGGPNFIVDAACASSLAALEAGVKELRHGVSDVVLVGGAEAGQNPFGFQLFASTRALSPQGRSRPFDANGDGIAISDGVAIAVLKRLADAERDGDRVYAVIRHVGAASDGREKSLTAPAVGGQSRAVNRAYAPLEITPRAVGLVEAHGTGTAVGDRTELQTLHEVFTQAGAAPQSCALGSVKSQIGHTKSTAGLAALVKVAMSLHTRVLPPTLAGDPAPALRDRSIPFYLSTRPRPWFAGPEGKRFGALSAFGFGGTNFHAVLQDHAASAVSLAERPAELFVFRAATADDLAAQAESLSARLAQKCGFRPIQLADALARKAARASGEHRLAIVAKDFSDLRTRLDSAARRLRTGELFAPTDPLFYRHGLSTGKLALLFPGQGSQAVDMLEQLALCFPLVREVFERADAVLAETLPQRLSSVVYPPPAYSSEEAETQARLLNQTQFAQPALGAAGYAAFALLNDLGVRPDFLAGHSYGEYVALCAADVVSFADLMRISERRGRVVEETQGSGEVQMVAIQADARDLATLLEESEGVALAGDNAPGQAIVGGARAGMASFMEKLKAQGIGHIELAMSAGFHIPEAKPAADRFAEFLETVDLHAPSQPVYSNLHARPYPADAGSMRETLIAQLTEPLRFREEIEALYAAGTRVFIETGPGKVLSGLVRRTLGTREASILTVDRGSGEGLSDFLRVLGSLYVNGKPMRLEKLFNSCGLLRNDFEELVQPERAFAPGEWIVDGLRARPALEPVASPEPLKPMPRKIEPTVSHVPSMDPAAMTAFQSTMQQFLVNQQEAGRQRMEVMSRFLETMRTMSGGAAMPAQNTTPLPERPAVPALQREETLVKGPIDNRPQVNNLPHKVSLERTLLELIGARTGYPLEILELDHNLEADLGIDSIKRTEIFGALLEKVGANQTEADKDDYFLAISKLRTLREVLNWLKQHVKSGEPEITQTALPETSDERTYPVNRYVVRAFPAPLPKAGAGFIANGTILVTEDRSGRGTEAVAAMTGLGLKAALVRHCQETRVLAQGRYECDLLSPESVGKLREWVHRDLGSITSLCHLMPLSGPPLNGSGPHLDDAIEVRSLLLLSKAFGNDLRENRGALVAVTPMGGRFGVQDEPRHVTAGVAALPGFLKSLALEWPEVTVKCIDVDPKADPYATLSQLGDEFGSGDGMVEVGYGSEGRVILEPVEQPLTRGRAAPALNERSVVLVTGGARGITAEVCRSIAARYRPLLVIAGRSPLPGQEDSETANLSNAWDLKRAILERRKRRHQMATPATVDAEYREIQRSREVRANLDAITQSGARWEYHELDVRDSAAFERLIQQTYTKHGRLDGVIHGAGVVEDSLVIAKSLESFDRVFDTKLAPARVLARTLRPDSLSFLVFFSSIAARFGYAGGTDYCAANEALNQLAIELNAGWAARVVSIGWGPWGEVGMAAQYPEELQRERGTASFPVQTGCQILLDELTYGRKQDAAILIYSPVSKEQPRQLATSTR